MTLKQPEKTWEARGVWRYDTMVPSSYDGKISRTYQYRPTPTEVRSDLETDVTEEHGPHTVVDRIAVFEVVTTHLFDA